MDYVNMIYESQLDLKSYPKEQLQTLATKLSLPTNLSEEDLTWLISLKLITKYRIKDTPIRIRWGKFAGRQKYLDKFYDDFASKFVKFSKHSDIGGNERRYFNAENIIQFAIENKLTARPIEEIYYKFIIEKLT